MTRASKTGLAAAILLLAASGAWLFHSTRPNEQPRSSLRAPEGSGARTVVLPRAPAVAIRGVVTHGGVPVAGAEVVALPMTEADQASCDASDGQGGSCGCAAVSQRLEVLRSRAERLAATRTAADGSFAVEVGPPSRLVALVPGRGLVGQAVLTAGASSADIAVAPGQMVRGTAVDHEGRRLPDVTVFAESGGVVLGGRSDDDGGFQVGPLPSGMAVVTARHGDRIGFADARAGGMTLVVRPASRLAVAVRREGRPAAGAAVELSSGTCSSALLADASGEVSFEEVAQQSLHLTATLDGWAAAVDTQVRKPVEKVVLTLQPAGVVEGIVRSDRGEPVAGAVVEVAPAGRSPDIVFPPPPSYRAIRYTTDQAGRFRIPSLPTGAYDIAATADGFARGRLPARLLGGGASSIEITLATASSIRGRVVAPDGGAVAGVTVEAWTVDVASRSLSRTTPPAATATSDDDGTFELAELARQPHTIRAASPAGWHPALVVDAPGDDVVIALHPGGEVSGQVVDGSGGAVAGATVEIRSLIKGSESGFQRQVVADPAGRFAVTAVPPGELELTAASTQEGGARTSQYVTVRDVASSPVTLRLAGRLALTGRVRTRSGQPVAAATVVAYPAEQQNRPPIVFRGQTDGEGRFELGNLEAGVFRVTSHTESSAQAEPVVGEAGGPSVELVVDDLPALTGRVTDAARAPVVAFTVDGVVQNDADGVFRVPVTSFSPGNSIVIAAPGYAPSVLPLQPGATGQDLGEVVLTGPRNIAGRVTQAGTGAPVAGAEILFSRTPAMTSANTRGAAVDLLPSTTSGADGQFTIEAPEGEVPVLISHPKHQHLRLRLSATADHLDAALEPAPTVRGRVLDADGRPMQASVFFDGPTPDMIRTRTDGSFEATGMAPGTYFAEVRRPSPGGWKVLPRHQFAITGVADLDLELREPATLASLVVKVADGATPIPHLLLVRAEGDPMGTSSGEQTRVVNGQPDRNLVAFRYVDPGAYALVVATSKKVVVPRVNLTEPREYLLDVDLPAGAAEGGHEEGEQGDHDHDTDGSSQAAGDHGG